MKKRSLVKGQLQQVALNAVAQQSEAFTDVMRRNGFTRLTSLPTETLFTAHFDVDRFATQVTIAPRKNVVNAFIDLVDLQAVAPLNRVYHYVQVYPVDWSNQQIAESVFNVVADVYEKALPVKSVPTFHVKQF